MNGEKPFECPPYTMFHNHVIDVIMPRLSPNAWKVLCVAVRQTWGWEDKDSPTGRKQRDVISYSQFMEKTGIRSRATLARALRECLREQVLTRYVVGKDKRSGKPIYEYALNTDYTVSGANSVPLSSSKTVPLGGVGSGTKVEHTKETCCLKQQTKQVGGVLSDSQREAFDLLQSIDFQPPSEARRYARERPLEQIRGWVRYARTHKLGAGYVRLRLDAGEEPPEPVLAPTSKPRRVYT